MICNYCGIEIFEDKCPSCGYIHGTMQGGDGYFGIIRELNIKLSSNQSTDNMSKIAPQDGAKTNTKDFSEEIKKLKSQSSSLDNEKNTFEKELCDTKDDLSKLQKRHITMMLIMAIALVIAIIANVITFINMSNSKKELNDVLESVDDLKKELSSKDIEMDALLEDIQDKK